MKLDAFSETKRRRKKDEFLATITSIFAIARWFGIPVYGSKRFLCLTMLVLSMLIAIEFTALWKLMRAVTGNAANVADGRGVTARLSGAIFYGNSLLSLLLSWKVIRSWKDLSKYWSNIETKSGSGGLYLPPDWSIRRRVIYVSSFVAICALLEHIMSMMSATGFNCPLSDYFRLYILSSHGFMMQTYEYNVWIAIFVFIISKIATILWNFQDLIVILISMGLASRYHRLNLYVKQVVGLERRTKVYQQNSQLHTRVIVWRRLRQAYVHQSALVRKVDKELGVLVLLCNLNNFYFICLQLFLGLRKNGGEVISSVYYFLSLGWLLFRACSVCLAAADVHLHSRRALTSVCSCPSSSYNIEIKRLKYQLSYDYVYLTGMGLFRLDREKLLEVAAAIVKYELILIQFDK